MLLKILPRRLILMLMFLLGLLLPAGWLVAMASATATPSDSPPPLAAAQPTAFPSRPLSASSSFGGCIDFDRNPNGTATLQQVQAGLSTNAIINPLTVPFTGTTATIGDFVWHDQDADGLQDFGEPGVETVLCAICKVGISSPLKTITTTADGHYSFTIPITDTNAQYYLQFLPPPSYIFTEQDVNETNQKCEPIDSDVNPVTGLSDPFTLTLNKMNLDKDVGLLFAPTYCSDANLAIPDDDSTGVANTLTITQGGTIHDLNVFISTTHEWVGDLVYTLTHESGTSVTLIDRPGVPDESSSGCKGNDIDATLDDEAPWEVENQCADSSPTINGTFKPNDPLSAFDNLNLNGNWTLTVSDRAEKDEGTLVQWCMNPTLVSSSNNHRDHLASAANNSAPSDDCDPTPPPPDPIPTLSEWGLIVMGLLLLTVGTIFIMEQPVMASVSGGAMQLSQARKVPPFVPALFAKVLLVTSALVLTGFTIAIWAFDYAPTDADPGGSLISTIIFAYMLHLWLLPYDDWPDS